MTDYLPLLTRAVAALRVNTWETRREVYERARAAQRSFLEQRDPPATVAEFQRERLALEVAIQKVESEASGVPLSLPQRRNLTSTQTSHELAKPGSSGGIARSIASLFAATLAGGAVLIAIPFYMQGGIWLMRHAVGYSALTEMLVFLISILAIVCIAFARMIPNRFGRVLLISSYLFSATTWMSATLITYLYLGPLWLVIGAGIGIVGIMPVGVVGAALHADWLALGILVNGIALTFVAHGLASAALSKSKRKVG